MLVLVLVIFMLAACCGGTGGDPYLRDLDEYNKDNVK